jgi:hypothetical protein
LLAYCVDRHSLVPLSAQLLLKGSEDSCGMESFGGSRARNSGAVMVDGAAIILGHCIVGILAKCCFESLGSVSWVFRLIVMVRLQDLRHTWSLAHHNSFKMMFNSEYAL